MRRSVLIVLVFTCFYAHSQDATLRFKPGSSKLPDSTNSILKPLAYLLNDCNFTYYISGYADTVGTDKQNDIVSLRRARAVAQRMCELGVEWSNMVIRAHGRSMPVASNKTSRGRSLNRRTEIDAVRTSICEGHSDSNDDIEPLFEKLREGPSVFCIQPDRDTIVVGRQGTIIHYTAGTFANTDGCACLELYLYEYFNTSSFLLNNLTTTSDSNALVSGGMVKLEGRCGKQLLEYNKNKYLTILVPAVETEPGMKLLVAHRDRMKDYLNWHLNPDGDELEIADWLNLLNCGHGPITITRPPKCHFFFCRIKRFFTGTGKELSNYTKIVEEFTKERDMISKFDMDSTQLVSALQKSKDSAKNVLKYYVYKNASWDYHNIDRYKPGYRYNDMYVHEHPSQSTDVKMVYSRTKTVVPALIRKDNYLLANLVTGEAAWIVGLRYQNEEASLSLQQVNTSDKKSALQFKKVTIEELKTLLKKLD